MSPQIRAKRKKKPGLSYVATCAAGLEELVAGEITACGGRIVDKRGGTVKWQGNLEAGYRLCLWSRFASRVLVQFAEFTAPDTDTLYRQAGKIDWDEHFDPNNTFAVYCTLLDSPITHSKYAALRIKDAIVDQFRARTGRRPSVDVHQPGARFHLHIDGEQVTLAIDLSGDSLHRRGYRVAGVEAPLKESLAAAIVSLSGLDSSFPADSVVMDPMCGSGTFLIEAAMIYGDSAPGLQRKTFGFNFWQKHDQVLWEKLVTEAVAREEQGLNRKWPQIIGYDADPQAVSAARKNISEAGLDDRITVSQKQAAHLRRPAESGLLVVNPPYGERLSDKEEVKYLYRFMERKIQEEFFSWQIGFFASNPDLAGSSKIAWDETFKLFNGPIKCRLFTGSASRKVEKKQATNFALQDSTVPPEGEEFANRLRKNCQRLFRWAEAEGITCFRIYDADLPDYNIAVDLYEEWVHVQEYAPPKKIDPAKAAHRFGLALEIIREILKVPRSRLFIKTRQKKKGKDQYQKKKGKGKLLEVRENSSSFLVNFTDYLDTGLFLDHRETRKRLASLANGKKFLNLYGYTGSATVQAIAGGAIATTTVDSSATYLQRYRANLALNGFGGPQHVTVQKDCMRWLKESRERFGVIFVDPPTFSNDRHRKNVFSVQDDHETLLRLAMKRLTRDGLLVFSTNFRKFKLAESLQQDFGVREITEQTIPEDFRRKPPAHRCWELRHLQEEEGHGA